LRIVNLPVNVADKKIKAIFLADSSCRVSLLGRSCFYAPAQLDCSNYDLMAGSNLHFNIPSLIPNIGHIEDTAKMYVTFLS
jgi:hypothetical protein